MSDLLQRQRTSQEGSSWDMQLGSAGCFVLSLVILVAGFWRLSVIEASEIQLLLGALLILNLTVMGVVTGLLLPLYARTLAAATQSASQARS